MHPLAAFVSTTLPLFVLLASPSAQAKPINMQDGEWRTTVKIEMPGMPMKMPPFSTTSCVTQKDLVPSTAQQNQDCKVTKQKITANSVEWTLVCKDKSGTETKGDGKITYSGTTYKGAMTLNIQGAGPRAMQMTYQLEGERLGPCKKKKK